MTRQHRYRKSILTARRRRMRKEVADRIREITAKSGAAHVEEVRDVALEDATVPQLREQAKELGLTGTSKLNKAGLIDLIREHNRRSL